jgi:hypothetical protein
MEFMGGFLFPFVIHFSIKYLDKLNPIIINLDFFELAFTIYS